MVTIVATFRTNPEKWLGDVFLNFATVEYDMVAFDRT